MNYFVAILAPHNYIYNSLFNYGIFFQQHCGWVQLGVGLEGQSLSVTIWSAEGLPMVESSDSLALPKAYAIIRLSVYG